MSTALDSRLREAELLANALCRRCGKLPHSPGRSRCADCRRINRDRMRRKRGGMRQVIEFRSEQNIGADPDMAAEIVREVVRAAGQHKLMVTSLTLEKKALQVAIRVPPELLGPTAPAYVKEVSARLMEALQLGAMRGAGTITVAASSPHG
jgi:ribosomal protein L37E